jgi:hypothetical protein
LCVCCAVERAVDRVEAREGGMEELHAEAAAAAVVAVLMHVVDDTRPAMWLGGARLSTERSGPIDGRAPARCRPSLLMLEGVFVVRRCNETQ